MYSVVDQRYLSERFKQISKHHFALNKASPYHTIITYSLNVRQLTSNEMKPIGLVTISVS